MSDFLKLLAFGATAVAAVAVAKEVIERTERGEDCSPIAVIKGICRKIGALCDCKCCKDSDDCIDFSDIDDFDLLGEDDDEDFFIDAADVDEFDGEEFVQLEIETEPAVGVEPEDTVEPDDDTVDEALKSVAESFDDESDSDEEDDTIDVEE